MFINKVDHDPAPIRMLMDRLQAISERPMILRQVPLLKGEAVTGYIDPVSARAYRYADEGPSALIEMPADDPGGTAREELLETLADYDDVILEHLLEDRQPATSEVYQQFTETLRDDLLVPVLLGAGALDRGVQRLLKTLRHDTPPVEVAAARRGFDGAGEVAAEVFKTMHAPHLGKLSLARLWRGTIKNGDHFGSQRLSGLYQPLGGKLDKRPTALAGEVVALGRLEETATGDVVGAAPAGRVPWPAPLPPVFALAITATSREDEVKLSGALQTLVEEDRALAVDHNAELSELTLEGQGDTHLRVVLERLVDRFHLTVDTAAPQTPTVRPSPNQSNNTLAIKNSPAVMVSSAMSRSPFGRGRAVKDLIFPIPWLAARCRAISFRRSVTGCATISSAARSAFKWSMSKWS